VVESGENFMVYRLLMHRFSTSSLLSKDLDLRMTPLIPNVTKLEN
jgi:hypothetical protein